jgi:lantibiotic biosynthesis protein
MLNMPVPLLLASFSHLHAIRLLRSAARTHELVLLSFPDRHYTSKLARAPR